MFLSKWETVNISAVRPPKHFGKNNASQIQQFPILIKTMYAVKNYFNKKEILKKTMSRRDNSFAPQGQKIIACRNAAGQRIKKHHALKGQNNSPRRGEMMRNRRTQHHTNPKPCKGEII
jgi:hypothetical protein